MLEKTPESPLDCKAIQPVHYKGDQSWVFIGRTDVEAKTPIQWSILCIYIHTHHILFNHSSVHLLTDVGCFYLLAIVNNGAVNIGIAEVCVWGSFCFPLFWVYIWRWLGYMLILCLTFWGTAKAHPLHFENQHCQTHSIELLGNLTGRVIRGPTRDLAGLVPDFMPGPRWIV